MTEQQKLTQKWSKTWLEYHHVTDLVMEMVNLFQTNTPKFKRLEKRRSELAKKGNELNELLNHLEGRTE